MPDDDARGPFPLSYVLTHELRELRPTDQPDQPGAERVAALPTDLVQGNDPAVEPGRRAAVYQAAHAAELKALCLSGGGIRSASFCLGVIQGLAEIRGHGEEKSLLEQFDYLSTVSGGGYIGSWLSAWLVREGDGAEVIRQLKAARGNSDAEPPPIQHLREYSSYLTAKVGLLSGDTWAAVAIVLRNIIVNWLIFAPLFGLVVIAFKFISAWLAHSTFSFGGLFDAVATIAALSLVLSLGYKLVWLYVIDRSETGGGAQGHFLMFSLTQRLLPASALPGSRSLHRQHSTLQAKSCRPGA